MNHEKVDSYQRRRRVFRRLGPGDFDGDSAGESFWVGDYEYVVEVGNPFIPAIIIRLSENGMSMPANFFFLYPALWVAWRIEPRARVAVFRRTGHKYFRMVHVEYVPDIEIGERRQAEIRKSWDYGDYQTSPILKVGEVLSTYRAARRSVPRAKL